VAKFSVENTAMTVCGLREITMRCCRRAVRHRAFTLIELMAVVLVVLLLAAIGMGVAGYVQKKIAVSTTKSQIAAIEAALENYKSDWGYYPHTTAKRISHNNTVEQTNNLILCRALFNQGKQYLNFTKTQLHVSYVGTNYGWVASMGLTGSAVMMFDVYGTPFNYFCSPNTSYSLGMDVTTNGTNLATNYFTIGGQINGASYDLFSYGRDRVTFADKNASTWPSPYNLSPGAEGLPWTNITAIIDDITNWRQ
jgi:prepilin-type N-terminal cleavage/methylation domain-containing protein